MNHTLGALSRESCKACQHCEMVLDAQNPPHHHAMNVTLLALAHVNQIQLEPVPKPATLDWFCRTHWLGNCWVLGMAHWAQFNTTFHLGMSDVGADRA